MKGGDFSYYKRNKAVDCNKEELSEPVFKVVFCIFLPSERAAVSAILNAGKIIYNPDG